MFKQMWANYVKNFAQNPEYCAKVYLVVCGCLGGAVGAATYWHDRCKDLKRIIELQRFENDLLRKTIKASQEEEE